MIENRSIIIFELEKPLSEALSDQLKEPSKIDSVINPFALIESNHVEKARLLKKWKKSEGYYYLNPEKFQFSLRNL